LPAEASVAELGILTVCVKAPLESIKTTIDIAGYVADDVDGVTVGVILTVA
jgi:hypothetical protein